MLEILYNLSEKGFFFIVVIIIISVIFVVLIIEIFIFIVNLLVKKRSEYERIVKDTSQRYKDILDINSRYDFYNLRAKYDYYKQHKSKAQFDRFNHTKFLEEQIEKDVKFFEVLLKETAENISLMEQYESDLMNISPFTDKDTFNIEGVSFSKYRKMEEKVVSNAILRPILKPKVIIGSSYISPKGRNSYSDDRTFSCSELAEEYNIVIQNLEKRATKEYQRKMMTDSLRYDIMKRDGFRCVLCGRSADDGVKLHVDHIIPVSKGGKTVPSNLRTLCDSCNFGKRDKYDEYGIN